MKSNKQFENQSTVGNKFFENVPPVGKSNGLILLGKSNGVPQVTADVTETAILQKLSASLKVRDTTVVKGFGGTALFALGLLATAKESGECIRLDDDTDKEDRLSDAEQIFRRNSTIVRKYYKEEESLENGDSNCEVSDDGLMSMDLSDEVLASDYAMKTGKFANVRKQTESLRIDDKV